MDNNIEARVHETIRLMLPEFLAAVFTKAFPSEKFTEEEFDKFAQTVKDFVEGIDRTEEEETLEESELPEKANDYTSEKISAETAYWEACNEMLKFSGKKMAEPKGFALEPGTLNAEEAIEAIKRRISAKRFLLDLTRKELDTSVLAKDSTAYRELLTANIGNALEDIKHLYSILLYLVEYKYEDLSPESDE